MSGRPQTPGWWLSLARGLQSWPFSPMRPVCVGSWPTLSPWGGTPGPWLYSDTRRESSTPTPASTVMNGCPRPRGGRRVMGASGAAGLAGSQVPMHAAHLGADTGIRRVSRLGPMPLASQAPATFCSFLLLEATERDLLGTHTFQTQGEAGLTERQRPARSMRMEGLQTHVLATAGRHCPPEGGPHSDPKSLPGALTPKGFKSVWQGLRARD